MRMRSYGSSDIYDPEVYDLFSRGFDDVKRYSATSKEADSQLRKIIMNDYYLPVISILSDDMPIEKKLNLLEFAYSNNKFFAASALLESITDAGPYGSKPFLSKEVLNWSCEDGATLLHCAAATGLCGIYFVVKRLIQLGVNINAVTTQGCTPLHLAAEHGHADIVNMLLAEDNIVVDHRDHAGETALHKAVQRESVDEESVDAIKLLLNAHADFTIKNKQNESPYSLAHSDSDVHYRSANLMDNKKSYWSRLRNDAEQQIAKGHPEKARKIGALLDDLSDLNRDNKVMMLNNTIKGNGEYGPDLCKKHNYLFRMFTPKNKVTRHLQKLLKEIKPHSSLIKKCC